MAKFNITVSYFFTKEGSLDRYILYPGIILGVLRERNSFLVITVNYSYLYLVTIRIKLSEEIP